MCPFSPASAPFTDHVTGLAHGICHYADCALGRCVYDATVLSLARLQSRVAVGVTSVSDSVHRPLTSVHSWSCAMTLSVNVYVTAVQ